MRQVKSEVNILTEVIIIMTKSRERPGAGCAPLATTGRKPAGGSQSPPPQASVELFTGETRGRGLFSAQGGAEQSCQHVVTYL